MTLARAAFQLSVLHCIMLIITATSSIVLQALPGKLTLHAADLLKKGSFDKVVDGAHFVFHTASPFQRLACSFGCGTAQAHPQGNMAVPPSLIQS